MEENFNGYNEDLEASVRRYNDMRKNKENLYFDVFEFEHIIDFFMEKNDFNIAHEAVEYALNQHPNSVELQLKKAQTLINKGFPLKSLNLLEKIEKIEATNHLIHYLQGTIYTSLGNIHKALELFEKAIKFSFDAKDELLYNIASSLKQAGRYDLANKYIQEVYKANPQDPFAIFELANNYQKLMDDKKSIKYYKEYISLNPFSSTVWFNLGMAYQKLENHEKAIEAFDYAIALEPEFKSAFFQKGLSQYQLNQFYESIETFEDLLELDNDELDAIFHIGEIYAKLGNQSKALEYFDRVIDMDNEHEDAWYSKALIYYEKDKFVDALYYLKKALYIENEDSDFWQLSALICRKLDFTEEAEKAFKKALKLNDNDPNIWIEYSKINFGHAKIYKTINILSEANELFSDNAEINYRLAAYLAIINNFDGALFHLQQALEQNSKKLDIFRLIYTETNNDIEELIANYRVSKQTNN